MENVIESLSLQAKGKGGMAGMSIYLDIGVVVILVIAMITGWRRGVARSLIRLLGAVGSLILSSLLASSLAPYVFEALVRPSLTGKIEQALAASPAQDIAQKLQELFNALPQFVSSLLEQYGITNGRMEQILASGTQDTAKTLVDTISPAVVEPIRVVLMFLLFLILMVVVGILARAVGRIFRLPVLRQADSLIGLVVGLFSGVVVLLVICLVVRAVVPMVPAGNWFTNVFSQESIQSSALFRMIYEWNPLDPLLSLF